ncbi:MAG TPA: MucR family transcriptional regulator [Qipengyuania sp.]|nr:MucR family transcriptional regulator [Qipengyuania sp.]
MDTSEYDRNETLITLTSEIVAAHVSNNSVSSGEVATLISSVYSALSGLGNEAAAAAPAPEPAVSIRASVKRDHLTCLDCGKKMKMLRRHLSSEHDMSPADYREKWGLSADYPMVAPEYAETRRDLAVKIGLGRKPGQRRGRRKKGA